VHRAHAGFTRAGTYAFAGISVVGRLIDEASSSSTSSLYSKPSSTCFWMVSVERMEGNRPHPSASKWWRPIA